MKKDSVTYGPYSPIFKVGDIYFISGHLGVDNHTKVAPNTLEEQAHLMLKNLQQTLSTEGLSLSDIAKTTIFLRNIDDFDTFNAIYMEYFDEPRPARSCVEVSNLPKVTRDNSVPLIEIEAVAYKGGHE